MSYCTPCPPCDTNFPLLCEPLETTANGKRLVVEDSAACQKTIQSPATQQVLKTDGAGNLTWTNGDGNSVLTKNASGALEFSDGSLSEPIVLPSVAIHTSNTVAKQFVLLDDGTVKAWEPTITGNVIAAWNGSDWSAVTLNTLLQASDIDAGSKNITTTGNISSGNITASGKISTPTIQVNRPNDYWATGDFYDVDSLGQLSSHGSYEVTLTSNGYRNNSGTWTSLNANSFTGASQLRLDPEGNIYFATDASKATGSTVNPTVRMTVNNLGNVGIGTTTPDSNAILQLNSTTQGLLFPKMTTTQKNAISTPPSGLVLYDTTTNKLCVYNGTSWIDLH